jgi:hypothetical protein
VDGIPDVYLEIYDDLEQDEPTKAFDGNEDTNGVKNRRYVTYRDA